ncbi:MAG TPA: COX15/CtaA family protein [Micromonosporaceae bacterium]|nr:COX15/CtaA family protein [Micromonosporaceae bacterium]
MYGTSLLRRVALASVIANIGIVITGGAVRLTGSGLGCPTWPRCTDDSYVATPEMGIYGAIEFGNRLVTFILGAIALAGVGLALFQEPRRRRVVWLSILAFSAIPAQAVVGGFTVLTDLNPWVVGLHFLVSMAAIAAAYAFWRATTETDAPVRPTVPTALRVLTWVVLTVTAAVLVIGTFVTGSGPHAGDANAKRNGLNPEMISQLHADVVFLLIGLVVAAWFAFRAVGARRAEVRTAWLLGIALAQGLIGFVQYFTNLPALLVGAHMAGSCAVWLAALAVESATRTREPLSPVPPSPPAPADHEPQVMINAE